MEHDIENIIEVSLGIDIGEIYYCASAFFINEEKEYITELIPNEKGNRMTKINKLSIDKIIDIIINNTSIHFKEQYNKIKINRIILSISYDTSIIQKENILKSLDKKNYKKKILFINEYSSSILYFRKSIFQNEINDLIIIDIGGITTKYFSLTSEFNKLNGIIRNSNLLCDKIEFGGNNFDNVLLQYCIDEFNKNNNEYLEIKEYSNDNLIYCQLKNLVEEAKMRLSNEEETIIEQDNFYNGKNLFIEITRQQFENLIKEIINILINKLNDFINENKIVISKINYIILQGGSFKISKIKNRFSNYFKNKNNKIEILSSINSDEINVMGTSSYYENIFDVNLNENILKYSIGIKTEGGLMSTIIEKGTKIPIKCQKNFITTEDNQKNIIFNIYMGEHYICKKNKIIKKYNLKNLPEKEKGEIEIIVTFYIDKNWEFNCIFEEKKFTNKKEEIYIGNIYNIEKKYNEMSNKKVKIVMTDQSQIIENKEKEKIIKIINLSRSIDLCMKQGKMSKGEGFAEKRWILNKTRSIVDFNKKENYFNNLLFNKIVENDRYNQNNNQNL
jgi:molecular chaperone DnaK